ncbi:MAG: gamma-glutamyl-gamma-aminobutyrate hydrolase family protein [Tannerella sp.]|jgi:gamma-glutamyl-gamma-aminobutyrate hydrolase PuuD|nr:gamma-glutamyl-gamma-aminobutyrate hydrolase family protein [Tannerella sp.]
MIQRKVRITRIIIWFIVFSACIWETNARRRPVIGVADASKDGKNAAVPRSYIDAVLQSGGIPVVIPTLYDEKEMIELLNTMDGIVFAGGGDFAPAYYNERPIPQMGKVNVSRDEFEMKLVRLAAERSIPILGICRGLQLINIAFGGSLYQDLAAQYYDNSIGHRQKLPNEEASHAVYVEDHTVFADIVKERMLMVNSSHHQAIKKVARGFRVAGKSPDKIVEVIEKMDDENWILGVQFHPEARVTKDHAMHSIFRRFVDEAGGSEKPDRTVKTVSAASRSQARRESGAEPQIMHEQVSSPASPPQVIYKSVTDTQFIYKFVRDTQYVYAPVDTVYVSVSDTKYVLMPVDTVYVSDTVYISVSDGTVPASDTPQSLPVTKRSEPEVVKSVSASVHRPGTDAIKSVSNVTPEVANVTSDAANVTPHVAKTAPDTAKIASGLIFVPGTPDTLKTQTKADVSGSKKKEEKERAKKERKEAEEKQKQYRKEQIEKTKQHKKAQKEKEQQAEKAKKEQIEKEKQFKQQQKESEKQDKRELKKMKKQKKTE